MPKNAQTFRAFIALSIFFQVVGAIPDLATRPAYGVGALLGCLLWIVPATLTLRGSDGARKFIVFWTCLSLGASLLGVLGGVVLLAATMEPLIILAIALSAVAVFVYGGLLKSATDDDFRAWVIDKEVERANAKLALA